MDKLGPRTLKLGPPTGDGSVTSVALSLPAIITVTGSPVTTSGTLTGTLASQTVNVVWAGPASGADAKPTFRLLVAADIPSPLVACFLESAGSINLAPGGNAYVDITWATEIRKDSSAYTHTASSATVTILLAGDYLITADVGAQAGVSGTSVKARLTNNGSAITGALAVAEDTLGTGCHTSITMVCTFAANDALKLQAGVDGGVGTLVTRANETRLTIRKL